MAIEYRPIEIQDHERVRRFLSELGWENRVQDPVRFGRMMARADRTIVAFDETRVVGFGRALCDGVSNGYLSMIAVAADKRRQGIGRELVQRLTANEADEHITWVLRAGRNSSAFWRSLGFTESKIAMERTRQKE